MFYLKFITPKCENCPEFLHFCWIIEEEPYAFSMFWKYFLTNLDFGYIFCHLGWQDLPLFAPLADTTNTDTDTNTYTYTNTDTNTTDTDTNTNDTIIDTDTNTDTDTTNTETTDTNSTDTDTTDTDTTDTDTSDTDTTNTDSTDTNTNTNTNTNIYTYTDTNNDTYTDTDTDTTNTDTKSTHCTSSTTFVVLVFGYSKIYTEQDFGGHVDLIDRCFWIWEINKTRKAMKEAMKKPIAAVLNCINK